MHTAYVKVIDGPEFHTLQSRSEFSHFHVFSTVQTNANTYKYFLIFGYNSNQMGHKMTQNELIAICKAINLDQVKAEDICTVQP